MGDVLIVAVIWFVLFFYYRQYFSGMFTTKASSSSFLPLRLETPIKSPCRQIGSYEATKRLREGGI